VLQELGDLIACETGSTKDGKGFVSRIHKEILHISNRKKQNNPIKKGKGSE